MDARAMTKRLLGVRHDRLDVADPKKEQLPVHPFDPP